MDGESDVMDYEEDVMTRCCQQLQATLQLHEPVSRYNSCGPAVIREYLYLGDFGDASSLGLLSELGITHLLNCAGVVSNQGFYRPPHGGSTVPRYYKQFEAIDCEEYDLSAHFDEAFQYIDEARSEGGKVLVYCVRGVNRSAAICVAYLVARDGADLSTAVTHVALARGRVLTNPGFQKQLVKFAAKCKRLPENSC